MKITFTACFKTSLGVFPVRVFAISNTILNLRLKNYKIVVKCQIKH